MDKIEILNESRLARLIYDATKSLFEAHKKNLLARLITETKSGPVDPQTYAKFLGGIAVIEDLDLAIRKNILKGETIEKELLDAATRTTRN
jgi:uncharacterized phage-associated protein